jgi:hypothetical protein
VTPLTTHTDIVTRFPLSAEVVWRRYLEVTADLSGDEYEQIEPRAWEQLQVALGHLESPAPLTVD